MNDNFSITQRGFAFTLEPKKREILTLQCGKEYQSSNYFVTGYLIDEKNQKYYIECYKCIPISEGESKLNFMNFQLIITKKNKDDDLIEYLAKCVQDVINVHNKVYKDNCNNKCSICMKTIF